MDYPTINEVLAADRITVARWYRFLRSPEGDIERLMMDQIRERFREAGGMTPELSKELLRGRAPA